MGLVQDLLGNYFKRNPILTWAQSSYVNLSTICPSLEEDSTDLQSDKRLFYGGNLLAFYSCLDLLSSVEIVRNKLSLSSWGMERHAIWLTNRIHELKGKSCFFAIYIEYNKVLVLVKELFGSHKF